MDHPDFIPAALMVLTYIMVGLCLGSFASAITYRIISQKSWIFERKEGSGDKAKPARSFCPSCLHQLSVLDLIPLFSWVFLAGKCRYCGVKIPARYPLIEIVGAIFMVAAYMMGVMGFAIILYVMTLPFLLTFLLLLFLKSKPPFYIYVLSFSNVFVLIYAVIWD
jgi:leader peptidase (prepilin peptidase)/N-methyltransferase